MRINQDNYEQFFLDHKEGNLSPEMEKELADFLEANPDLGSVLEEFDPSPLPIEEIINSSLKKRLKKNIHPTRHINEDNADEWMIRDIEGLLDDTEESEMKEFLSLNPAYGYDYKLFGYTKLIPDLSISYGRKNELKKRAVLLQVSRLAWLIPAAAAVILLYIGIRFFMQPGIQPSHPVILPIADLPRLTSPVINANSSFPAIEKKTAEIRISSRIPSIRIKSVDAQVSIFFKPSVEMAMTIPGRKNLPLTTAGKKEPSLIARIFNNMVDRAPGGSNNQVNFNRIRRPDLDFWSIAKTGIKGFNSISDRDLELFVRKDEDGKVKSYALVEQERLILAKELNKD